jgi:hypothetical protein
LIFSDLVVVELAAQLGDAVVDAAVQPVELDAAHLLEQFVARQHAAGRLGQHQQQLVFGIAEHAGSSRHTDGAVGADDAQGAEFQQFAVCRRRLGLGAAQQGAQARQQHARLHRLVDEIVRALFQARHFVVGIFARGQDQDRHLG